MMHYRVQYLAVTTTVLSLILPTGLALSDMGVADAKRRSISQRLSQKSITAQVQTKKQLGEEALRLYKSGSELYRKGLRIEGFEKFQQALKIFRQIGDRAQEGYILKKIGEAYFYTEDFATALNSYQKALAIFKEIDDELGIAKSLRGMGNIYSSVGEYSKSSDSYQQALNIFKKIGNRVEEGWTLKDIGYSLYGSQENYSKALDYLWEALIVLRKTNDKLGESVTLKDIALIYSRQGNFLKALEYGKQASVIARQIKDKQLLAWILSDIGEHYFKLKKDYPKALEYFNKALNVFEKIDHWGGRGWVLKHIAESNFKLKRYDKALQYFQQALTVFERIGSLNGQGWTLDDMAEIYFVIGRYSDAEKALWDTITIWEYSKEKLNDTQKITIANNKRSTFRLMQRVLIAQNKVETALEISERSRSRALIDLLASKQSADSNNQVYSKSPSLEDMKRIAKQRNATIVEYSVIDSGEHLVIDDSLLYIWVVKPTGEIAFEKVDIKTFNKPLKNFVASSRNSIGARGRGIFKIAQNPLTRKLYSRSQTNQKQNLYKLHKLLIKPIAHHLPKNQNERVIFIPHDSLFLVPFPALIDENGTYLIEKHTILTSPAIQVLGLTNQQKQRLGKLDFKSLKSQTALVVGNPIMPYIGTPPKQLYSLPGAEKEANKIAKILNTEPLIGKKATKATVLKKMPSAKVIHLATHGLLDDFGGRVPGALALTPDTATSKNEPNEGLLKATEIINLDINANLVVLSACDTGRGKITSDGVIGLSRALITAGTPSVIVSLWSVPDAPTAELMTEFYSQLKLTGDKAQSLRHAMLKLKEKYPDTPRKWAAFTLIGEAD